MHVFTYDLKYLTHYSKNRVLHFSQRLEFSSSVPQEIGQVEVWGLNRYKSSTHSPNKPSGKIETPTCDFWLSFRRSTSLNRLSKSASRRLFERFVEALSAAWRNMEDDGLEVRKSRPASSRSGAEWRSVPRSGRRSGACAGTAGLDFAGNGARRYEDIGGDGEPMRLMVMWSQWMEIPLESVRGGRERVWGEREKERMRNQDWKVETVETVETKISDAPKWIFKPKHRDQI